MKKIISVLTCLFCFHIHGADAGPSFSDSHRAMRAALIFAAGAELNSLNWRLPLAQRAAVQQEIHDTCSRMLSHTEDLSDREIFQAMFRSYIPAQHAQLNACAQFLSLFNRAYTHGGVNALNFTERLIFETLRLAYTTTVGAKEYASEDKTRYLYVLNMVDRFMRTAPAQLPAPQGNPADDNSSDDGEDDIRFATGPQMPVPAPAPALPLNASSMEDVD